MYSDALHPDLGQSRHLIQSALKQTECQTIENVHKYTAGAQDGTESERANNDGD
jgi:hypothetical protein